MPKMVSSKIDELLSEWYVKGDISFEESTAISAGINILAAMEEAPRQFGTIAWNEAKKLAKCKIVDTIQL